MTDKEDQDQEDFDPAQHVYSGICRACKKFSHTVSGDSGYCGDCD